MPESGWIESFGITAGTVVTGVPEVHPVIAGEGALLVDLRTRGVHEVNTTAAAVFALCDGELDVDGVVDELASIYGVDRATIADDVVGTVAQYAALGLVQLRSDAPPDGAAAGDAPARPDADPRHVPAPCSPCQDTIDALGWGPTVALAAGDLVLGARGDDEATAERIRARFADRVVDDPEAPPNFSVVLLGGRDGAEPTGDPAPEPPGPHPRSGLYERHLFVSGDLRDEDEILDLLARRLRQHDPVPAGCVRLQASALVGDTGAVLAPWQGTHPDPGLLAAVASHPGWAIVAAPVEVRAESDAVVLDDGAEVRLAGVVGSTGETTRITGVEAASALLVLALPSDERADEELQAVADLSARVPVVGTTPDKVGDVAAALVRAR